MTIKHGPVQAEELLPNTIYIRIDAAHIHSTAGLAADTTGVKATSNPFKFSQKHVKQLILRSSITSIPSDAVVRVGVYNITTGAYIFYRDYSGETGEYEDVYTGTMPADGDLLEIRVEVITASGTSGAVFDLGYAVLYIDYGVS